MANTAVWTMGYGDRIPTNLTEHKAINCHRDKSSSTAEARSSSWTPSHGNTQTYPRDTDCYADPTQQNIWAPDNSAADRLQIKINSGTSHTMNHTIRLATWRWLRCLKYVGFEIHQSDSRNNSIYLDKIALIYVHESRSEWRSWGTDWTGYKDWSGYRYFSHTMSQTEKDWQIKDGYVLSEFIFNLATSGGVGSSFISTCSVFNLKYLPGAGSEGQPTGRAQIAMPRNRAFADRNKMWYGE